MSTDFSAIVEWGKQEFQKNLATFDANKKTIVNKIKDRLVEAGMPKEFVCSFIVEKLAKSGYVSTTTVKNALSNEFKDKSKVRNNTDNSADPSQSIITKNSNIDTSSKTEPEKIVVHTDGSNPSEPETKTSTKSKNTNLNTLGKMAVHLMASLDESENKTKLNDFAKDLNQADEKLVPEDHKKQHDCTQDIRYKKLQAQKESLGNELEEIKKALETTTFAKANHVKSFFQIPRQANMENEFYYERIEPIEVIKKLKTKKVMKSNFIEIGWRIVEYCCL
jgi:hypothetical protein